MALTLIEAAKLAPPGPQRFVVDEFSQGQILGRIPFRNVDGGGLFYDVLGELPGVGFRAMNEAFSESTGVVNPQSEALKLYGGDLDVDRSQVMRYGAGIRSTHEQSKIKALRVNWEYQFIKGTSASDKRGFDGLQSRVTGRQLISNADAGGALSLKKLDELVSALEDITADTYLLMGRTMRDLLTAAGRNSTLNNLLSDGMDRFGRKVMMYGGVPILVDSRSNPIFAFTETSPDGSSSTACTSIYAVTFGDLAVTGIQGRNDEAPGGYGISARDLMEIPDKPVLRTRVDWDCSFAILNGYSVARLYGITNATVTA